MNGAQADALSDGGLLAGLIAHEGKTMNETKRQSTHYAGSRTNSCSSS